jgi:predicted MFS family arabinose efflux permease
MVLFFLTLYLTEKQGFSVTEAGLMISIYGAGGMAGSFVGGWLCKYFSAGNVQIFTLALSGLGFVGLQFISGYSEIAVWVFFLALSHEAFRPANASEVALVTPVRLRARAYGLNRLAVNIGIAIGPALGGVLATFDYAYLFWVDGLTCIGAAIALAMLYRHERIIRCEVGRQSSSRGRSPWRDLNFHVFLVVFFFFGLVFAQVFSNWPLYYREQFAFAEFEIGFLLALNAMLIALIEMPLIHRFENKEPLRVIAIGAIFFFLGFIVVPVDSSLIWAVFTVILWSIGEILIFPLASSFVANRASEANIGMYMGLFTLNFSLSIVVGPWLGAQIYTTLQPDYLWYAIIVLTLPVFSGLRYVQWREKK